jgi:hypothetical protein
MKETGFSPYIKSSNMILGFAACGKTPLSAMVLKGHDFSRAENAPKSRPGFSPSGRFFKLARYFICPALAVARRER